MTRNKQKLTTIELYNEIIEDLRSSKDLSNILPSVLILSKQLKSEELEKWTKLELNGYYSFNEALTEEVIVPEYRAVAGQYHDIYKRPLIITNPKLKFIGEYRLRQGVSELESLSQTQELLSIQDSTLTELIKDNLGVKVHTFSFTSTSIIGILQSIKTNLISKLMRIQPVIEQTTSQSENKNEHTIIHDAIANLHPLVQPVAAKLYSDGHYRQAILDTYILLVETVKTKSGRHDLDGTGLMQTVFSPKTPIVRISDDPDEQLGFMWMFSGAIMGIRNPKAHRLVQQTDPQRTLEWLSFASVLLRVLDDADVIKNG